MQRSQEWTEPSAYQLRRPRPASGARSSGGRHLEGRGRVHLPVVVV